jgi:hypothetical protein
MKLVNTSDLGGWFDGQWFCYVCNDRTPDPRWYHYEVVHNFLYPYDAAHSSNLWEVRQRVIR